MVGRETEIIFVNFPDANSVGFLSHYPDALRYERSSEDPDDVCKRLASLIVPKTRVLDVGCGTGSISELIQSYTQADFHCIEPDSERSACAAARGLKVFQGYLSDEFLREHGPFDHIVFADVLEHLPNPGEMVLIAKNGLAPGGSIIASVPNVAHWSVRLNLVRGRFNYQECGIMDATHLRWFTGSTLHQFFERLGFRVIDHSYTLNTLMAEYDWSRPWKWMPNEMKFFVIRRLLRLYPTLFGCQHVVKAVPK